MLFKQCTHLHVHLSAITPFNHDVIFQVTLFFKVLHFSALHQTSLISNNTFSQKKGKGAIKKGLFRRIQSTKWVLSPNEAKTSISTHFPHLNIKPHHSDSSILVNLVYNIATTTWTYHHSSLLKKNPMHIHPNNPVRSSIKATLED